MRKNALYTGKTKKSDEHKPIGLYKGKLDQYDQPDHDQITTIPRRLPTPTLPISHNSRGYRNKFILQNVGVVHG
jgi:hypothetical protein